MFLRDSGFVQLIVLAMLKPLNLVPFRSETIKLDIICPTNISPGPNHCCNNSVLYQAT